MNKSLPILVKVKQAWTEGGLRAVRNGVFNMLRRLRQERAYQRWIKRHEITPERRAELELAAGSLTERPLLSVILPVYDVDERWLRRCIDSVIDQIYPNWQLCIADDASPSPHIRSVLEEYSRKDDRISVVFRSENGHIAAASNSALELAEGEFVVLLDHDDELSADALYWVANEVNLFPAAAAIYSDEDLIDTDGRRFGPKFKPDFSRDLYYSLNLLTHLSAYRTDLVREIRGFRIGTEGSQDYDLGLRIIERVPEAHIRHIPRVLYHWRVIPGSVAFSMDQKPYAHERARNAIREHFARTGIAGEVVESTHNLHRVCYMRESRASICVIASSKTDASRIGIGMDVDLVIADRSPEGRNAAAAGSDADVLIFVDGDLRFADPGAVDDLAGFAMQDTIGAVGGRILSGGLVEEAGIVLRTDMSPAGAHRGFPPKAPGNMFRNWQVGNWSAVSIACLAIRRKLFEELGGFDASSALYDIELCLRLREGSQRIVVLPHVELIRKGRAIDREYRGEELARIRDRWPEYIERDPFCNPNLKRDGSFDIEA